MAGEVQRRRARHLGGTPLRAGLTRTILSRRRPHLSGLLGQRPVPVALPAGAGRPRRAAADAGVVSGDPDPRAALGAGARVAPAAGGVAAAGVRGGRARRPGRCQRGAGAVSPRGTVATHDAQAATRADRAAAPSPADRPPARPARSRPDAVAATRPGVACRAAAAPRPGRSGESAGAPPPSTWRTSATPCGRPAPSSGAAATSTGGTSRCAAARSARSRILLAPEEHGGGRQLLRFRIYPWVPPAWLTLAALSLAAGAGAAAGGAWLVAAPLAARRPAGRGAGVVR